MKDGNPLIQFRCEPELRNLIDRRATSLGLEIGDYLKQLARTEIADSAGGKSFSIVADQAASYGGMIINHHHPSRRRRGK